MRSDILLNATNALRYSDRALDSKDKKRISEAIMYLDGHIKLCSEIHEMWLVNELRNQRNHLLATLQSLMMNVA